MGKNDLKDEKKVYYFGGGEADGGTEMGKLLGGKGSNLAEMTNLGINVPPGFTITTNVCTYYVENKEYPEGLEEEVNENFLFSYCIEYMILMCKKALEKDPYNLDIICICLEILHKSKV